MASAHKKQLIAAMDASGLDPANFSHYGVGQAQNSPSKLGACLLPDDLSPPPKKRLKSAKRASSTKAVEWSLVPPRKEYDF